MADKSAAAAVVDDPSAGGGTSEFADADQGANAGNEGRRKRSRPVSIQEPC
jgi:hypothetical protein